MCIASSKLCLFSKKIDFNLIQLLHQNTTKAKEQINFPLNKFAINVNPKKWKNVVTCFQEDAFPQPHFLNFGAVRQLGSIEFPKCRISIICHRQWQHFQIAKRKMNKIRNFQQIQRNLIQQQHMKTKLCANSPWQNIPTKQNKYRYKIYQELKPSNK